MTLRDVFRNLGNYDDMEAQQRRAFARAFPHAAGPGGLSLGVSIPSVLRRRSTRQVPERFSQIRVVDSGPRTVVLAIQEPRVRTTKWHLGGHHHDRVLSMPRMLFFVCLFRGGFDNLYAFILKETYQGPASWLHHSILPNSDNSGWVCMGNGNTRDAITQETLSHPTLSDKVDAVLTAFWQGSYFNEDLLSRFTQHAPFLHTYLSSIAAWERASRVRPGFIHDVPWEFATTAGAVINQLRSGT